MSFIAELMGYEDNECVLNQKYPECRQFSHFRWDFTAEWGADDKLAAGRNQELISQKSSRVFTLADKI